jgi:hypothetical protein
MLLNLVLLGLIIATGFELRRQYEQARERESALMRQRVSPNPPPQVAPIPPVAPASAASYIDVANRVLFAKDRNPNVIVEVKAPPPPKEMPPLPFQYGVIDFGQGPTVMLAEKSGGAQKGYRIGDKIGAFKLLAVNRSHILLEWEDKKILKTLEDLVDRNAAAAAAANNPAPAPAAAAAAPATPKVIAPVAAGPGESVGAEFKACVPGDNSPAGTVVNGMKKVVSSTPFGQQCRWEPSK